jgi:hypothetical protein
MTKKSKLLKRQKEKEQKQQEQLKQIEYKDHLHKLKELCDEDTSQRMPIHIFTTDDDFIDQRMPISREKQMEIYKNTFKIEKFKPLT